MKLNKIIAILATSSFIIYTNATIAAPGGGGGPLATEVNPDCSYSDAGNTVTISWQEDSPIKTYSYTIALNHTGNTWTYTLTNGPGNQKNLSHWVLAIPSCKTHTSANPTPDDWGIDPTTGVDGAKWNTPSWSTSSTYFSTYTLTLDGNYPSTTVDVAAKSATYYGICQVIAPDCSKDPDPPAVVTLEDFTAKVTGNNGTQVKFTTSYEENIVAFRLYRGTPKIGTECTANEDDYNNVILVTILPSGKFNYNYHDEFGDEFAGADTICYGLTSIDEAGNDVDILGAVPRQ